MSPLPPSSLGAVRTLRRPASAWPHAEQAWHGSRQGALALQLAPGEGEGGHLMLGSLSVSKWRVRARLVCAVCVPVLRACVDRPRSGRSQSPASPTRSCWRGARTPPASASEICCCWTASTRTSAYVLRAAARRRAGSRAGHLLRELRPPSISAPRPAAAQVVFSSDRRRPVGAARPSLKFFSLAQLLLRTPPADTASADVHTHRVMFSSLPLLPQAALDKAGGVQGMVDDALTVAAAEGCSALVVFCTWRRC